MTSGATTARPFYDAPDLEGALAAARFDADTDAFVRALADDGGAFLDLGEDARALCDQAIADTDPYFEDAKVSRLQDAWFRSDAVRSLANLPRIREALRKAYGREPFAFQTLNFKRGSQQHFHSDTIHFDSLPQGFMCGVWIALEDVAPGSGPLVYKLGSHKLPVLTMQDVGVNDGAPTYADYERHYVPRFEERLEAAKLPTQVLHIKKGQAFVWSANLAHGGQPIADLASTRRSLVVHFYFEGCAYFTPMISNLAEGGMKLRLPTNLRTGLWTWPRRGGRRLKLPLRTILGAIRTRLWARPVVF